MGNAAGSSEQPASPAALSPKHPAAPKQPMPAAGELEERFNRVLVSVARCARGAGGGRQGLATRPRPRGLRYRLEISGGLVAAPPGGGSDSRFLKSDLALSPQNFLLQPSSLPPQDTPSHSASGSKGLNKNVLGGSWECSTRVGWGSRSTPFPTACRPSHRVR